jgi:transposase InsO family protein
VYGGDFGSRLAALGIEQRLTPVRAPRVNAVAERGLGMSGSGHGRPRGAVADLVPRDAP